VELADKHAWLSDATTVEIVEEVILVPGVPAGASCRRAIGLSDVHDLAPVDVCVEHRRNIPQVVAVTIVDALPM
jgi:hypothetical protein